MTTLFRVLTVLALIISVFSYFQAQKAMKYPIDLSQFVKGQSANAKIKDIENLESSVFSALDSLDNKVNALEDKIELGI